jgi:hypothetical protein
VASCPVLALLVVEAEQDVKRDVERR